VIVASEIILAIPHQIRVSAEICRDFCLWYHKKSPLDTRQFYWREENGKFAEGEFKFPNYSFFWYNQYNMNPIRGTKHVVCLMLRNL